MEPWGIPDVTADQVECRPSVTTRCRRSKR